LNKCGIQELHVQTDAIEYAYVVEGEGTFTLWFFSKFLWPPGDEVPGFQSWIMTISQGPHQLHLMSQMLTLSPRGSNTMVETGVQGHL